MASGGHYLLSTRNCLRSVQTQVQAAVLREGLSIARPTDTQQLDGISGLTKNTTAWVITDAGPELLSDVP